MLFWRKKNPPEFRRVQLPGDVGWVSIPASFVVEIENDSTFTAYPPGEEMITLRFSSVSAVMQEPVENGGRNFVRQSAVRDKHSYRELPGGKGVASHQKESTQDGVSLTHHFWLVGCRNTVTIVSATILKSKQRHEIVKATLAAMPVILESLEVTTTHRIITSGNREVHFISRDAESLPQCIRPFNENDEEWLATCLDHAEELGLKYGTGGKLNPEELDRIFSRWMAEDGEKESDALIANVLGAALGAYFVEQHRFRWMVVTDEYGTDYAVQHARGPTMAFPCSSVVKRIEHKEPEFFRDLYSMIFDQLKRPVEEDRQSD